MKKVTLICVTRQSVHDIKWHICLLATLTDEHVRKIVWQMKIKLKSFKRSEHINEKRDGPYRGFGYLSLFNDPLNLAKWSQRENCNFAIFNRIVETKRVLYKQAKNIKR